MIPHINKLKNKNSAYLKGETLSCLQSPSNQSYGFSSSHVWMWELDHKESWALKNRCFWTVVLEKTVETPLDYKEIQPVNPKGKQSWVFIRRTDAEAEAPILWPPDRKNWLDLLAIEGTLKSLLQHHSSKASILQSSIFFMVQLSHPYMTTGKAVDLSAG